MKEVENLQRQLSEGKLTRREFISRVDPPSEILRMNVTVIDAPFSESFVLGHVDTGSGSAVPNEGHIDDAHVSVKVPYELARQLLLERQPEMVMISFMSGEIEVEGDITRLLSLQDFEATAEQQRIAEQIAARLREITA